MRYWIAIVTFLLTGCVLLEHKQEINTLKNYAANQDEIDRYTERQKAGFDLLFEDIKNGRIKKGLSRIQIIKMYGQPVLIYQLEGQQETKEKMLYRYPAAYFPERKVFLYIDSLDNLLRWEYHSV